MAEEIDRDVGGVFAKPYVHDDVEKFEYIMGKCCEHRPWFDDWHWEDPFRRRLQIITHLSNASQKGAFLEVWRGSQVIGIILITDIRPFTEAKAHFLFFDKKLHDKRGLCLEVMQWTFNYFQLHRLGIEIPTYARALAAFAERKLGFRYESERLARKLPRYVEGALKVRDTDPEDRVRRKERATRQLKELIREASRRHQAIKYDGEWHDLLLLSITKEEFTEYYGRWKHRADPGQSPGSGTGATSDLPAAAIRSESPGDTEPVSAGTAGAERVEPAGGADVPAVDPTADGSTADFPTGNAAVARLGGSGVTGPDDSGSTDAAAAEPRPAKAADTAGGEPVPER